MSEQSEDKNEHSCVACDSTDAKRLDGDRRRCLDCGASYAVAPDGVVVYSRRVWWFSTIGNVLLVVAAFVAAFIFGVLGYADLMLMFIVTGAIFAVDGRNDIKQLVNHVR